MKETNVSRTAAQQTEVTSYATPAGEKTGQRAQATREAAPNHDRIARRAYELYDERGRQDGWALEDWLNAERQLVRTSGQSWQGPES